MEYEILVGDCIQRLLGIPDNSVHCVVTSPPYYGLRDYGVAGQIGLEATPQEFISKLVAVFREVRRVLRPDGTCWVNMGDSYAGGGAGGNSTRNANAPASQVNVRNSPSWLSASAMKPKDLMGMPWRLAFALQDDGWWLRQDIIWAKPNPMPESVTDRCTKAHEYIFLLTKSERYFYDAEAIKEKVSGGAHARVAGGTGVGFGHGYDAVQKPRYKKEDPNSRMHQDRDPGHSADRKVRAAGVGPKDSAEGSGTKYNESFSAAITDLVSVRNKRSVWEIATEPFSEAHFATFPKKLVELCILAGTSERGCCEACGAPWVRQTERSVSLESGSGKSGSQPDGKHAGGDQEHSGTYDIRMGPVITTHTIGWVASCKCGADAVACTVLDPFNGSGTTGLVALANRCNYIGIELNPEYAAMAERRLKSAQAQGVLI